MRGSWRYWEERAAKAFMLLSLGLVVGSLLVILGVVAVKGFSALTWQMLTQSPRGGYYLGKEGGILNAILGSLYLGAGATALAFAVSLPVALYLRVFAGPASVPARAVRFAMDLLWGVPSIVYGALGFVVMVLLGLRASLGAAILTVSLFELPILVRAMDEVLRMVPAEIDEASYSVGATRSETAFRVVTRQALPGILTAVLLAFGRGIGDTASVLFTAGFTDRVPTSLCAPAATLPLAVFFQLGSPIPEVRNRAYAAAAVLTLIVFAVSLLGRGLARMAARNVVR
jgi:phosphate transport system permease protein